jgi:replication initiation and membrane attachment protein DnaB
MTRSRRYHQRATWNQQRQVTLNLTVPLAPDGFIEDDQFERSLLTLMRYAACTSSRRLFETLSLTGSIAQIERRDDKVIGVTG